MFASKFHVVSVGIVAENKKLDSHDIAVVPIEMMTMVDGDLREGITEQIVEGLDKNNQEYQINITTGTTLTASWLPWGSNRVSSPDVRRGEHVLIWQLADVDRYYWTPMGIDDDLRRLETVIYAWSATQDEIAELNPLENMYSLEVSTHGKHITLHTTMANGEPYEYTIQLDTGNGQFALTDNVGNTITLNSRDTLIRFINADETEVTLDKTELRGYAKDNVHVRSDDTLTASSGGKMTLECEADLEGSVANNADITVGGDLDVQTGGDATLNVGGNIEGIAAGNIQIGASGNIILSNGSVGIKMVGGKISLG